MGFGVSGAAQVQDPAGGAGVPVWLRGLQAVNPNIAKDYQSDPGLRRFLDANKSNLVQWEKPPAGKVKDSVNMETWCHATSIVPAALRDQEYIVVVARGSAYQNNGNIQMPLQNGGTATSDGRIVFVGKTADYLNSNQQKADEGGHYPGAITLDVEVPVAGDVGEKVKLSYARVKPDDQGRMHPHHSGWPDSFKGVYGGYSGREIDLAPLGGNRRQQVDSPDGLSARGAGRFV